MQAPSEVVMEVRRLSKHFPLGTALPFGLGSGQKMIHAVDDVSFTLQRGQILALVGESGSGKSTIAHVLAGLYPATSGEVLFHGENVLKLRGRRAWLRYRGRVQMVFQDPFGSLNPVKTVAHQIQRPLTIHKRTSGRSSTGGTVHELLRTVGLTPPEEIARKFPHQLSGGQRQRISFARALAVNPEVILADEPISMLDVSIRMGILNLMAGLRTELGLSYLYITHDIASARYLADETLVLYAGQAVEMAQSEDVIADPLHPYTQLLLSAVPEPGVDLGLNRVEARGAIPTVINPKPGCRFANRCPHVMPVCKSTTPELIEVKPHHMVRCHLFSTPAASSA